MRYDTPQMDVLSNINPQNIRMYLISRGWENMRQEAKFDVFRNSSTEETLVVPNDRTLRDYAYRVEDIIDSLSRSESESPQSIIMGMTMSSSTDVISYHYEPDSKEVGLIPVADLESILNAGRNINNYAFRDMCDFKPRYTSSRWDRKHELDEIRVGPTLPASYVVQFIYPSLTAAGGIQTTLDGGVSIEHENLRLLCDKIELSLNEVIGAAERGKTELDSDAKISYNFVSSLRDLNFAGAEVEVRRTKTIGTPGGASRPMSLTHSVMRNIASIERNMRPEEMDSEVNIIGRLVQVNDLREEVGDEPVTMKIKYMDDRNDRILTAKFVVSGEDADMAYDAAKGRRTVSLTGVLTGPPRSRSLEQISDFKVLD